jgi:hypothetical protein
VQYVSLWRRTTNVDRESGRQEAVLPSVLFKGKGLSMKFDPNDIRVKRDGSQWLPKPIRDAVRDGLDYIEQLQQVNAELLAALKTIDEHTDPDSADNYRADDREGCLDAVYDTAQAAIEKARMI